MDQVSNQMLLLVIAEVSLLLIVLIFMPIYSCCVGKCQSVDEKAPQVPEIKEYFDKVLASFGTLTGAIIGFYFGNRGSDKKP